MRITEPIVARGNFWLPAHPERQVSGTLTIADGGKIHLDVLGSFEDWPEALTMRSTNVPRIVGQVENFGSVTLDSCFYESKTFSFGPPAANRLIVQLAFLKVAYAEGGSTDYTSFEFGVEGLDTWHLVSGVDLSFDLSTNNGTIRYTHPNPIVLWSGPGVRISLRFAGSFPSSRFGPVIKVSQSSFLRIEYDVPTGLETFREHLHGLVQFFCLATGKPVSIVNLSGRSPSVVEESVGGKEREIPVQIFFPTLSFSEVPPKINEQDMLFTFVDLGDRSQDVLDRWFKVHVKVGAGMNLFFSATGDEHKYLNTRFLLLAQALELYHRTTTSETEYPDSDFRPLRRRVIEATPDEYREFIGRKLAHANEVTLGTRFERLLGRFPAYFGDAAARKLLVSRIVKTRNYFTHFDPKEGAKAAEGIELWKLCQSMEALFRLLMLGDIGFSTPLIQAIVERNNPLRRALNEMRGPLPTQP